MKNMGKDKDAALSDWLGMTRKSGSYNDLTEEQRFNTMNAILFAFYKGARCGKHDKSGG